MQISRRQLILRGSAAAAALGTFGHARLAHAQPIEQVKVITGFAAGGTSDTLCRRVAEALRGDYGNAVLVENKTGAGGQIAIQAMRSVPNDGSVLLQTPASMLMIYPHIYKKLQYDPVKDLTPVSLACTFEFALAVGGAVPESVRTVQEFLVWAKADKARANFGSPAAGSVPHFIGELLSRAGSADLRHAPYRGTQPAVLDLIGGQISAVSGPIGDFMPHLSAGKIRLLGVSGAQRSRFVPNVPTYTEQGLKDMVFDEWFAFFLPAGAPEAVVQKASSALRAALAKKEVIDGLATMGLEAKSSSPAELAQLLARDTQRWGPIVKAIGFTADS